MYIIVPTIICIDRSAMKSIKFLSFFGDYFNQCEKGGNWY